jgi:hypothetical protein
MAEERQPTKRHKTSETHIQHDISQASSIGDELDPQILNPSGDEEENKFLLTNTTPKRTETHSMILMRGNHETITFSTLLDTSQIFEAVMVRLDSANILGVIDDIEDSKLKHQAYQYLRRSLKHVISRIEESTSTVKSELIQLQNNVSTQKDVVDILKAKVIKQRKLLKESKQAEDADLSDQAAELKESLTNLANELAPFEQV